MNPDGSDGSEGSILIAGAIKGLENDPERRSNGILIRRRDEPTICVSLFFLVYFIFLFLYYRKLSHAAGHLGPFSGCFTVVLRLNSGTYVMPPKRHKMVAGPKATKKSQNMFMIFRAQNLHIQLMIPCANRFDHCSSCQKYTLLACEALEPDRNNRPWVPVVGNEIFFTPHQPLGQHNRTHTHTHQHYHYPSSNGRRRLDACSLKIENFLRVIDSPGLDARVEGRPGAPARSKRCWFALDQPTGRTNCSDFIVVGTKKEPKRGV